MTAPLVCFLNLLYLPGLSAIVAMDVPAAQNPPVMAISVGRRKFPLLFSAVSSVFSSAADKVRAEDSLSCTERGAGVASVLSAVDLVSGFDGECASGDAEPAAAPDAERVPVGFCA